MIVPGANDSAQELTTVLGCSNNDGSEHSNDGGGEHSNDGGGEHNDNGGGEHNDRMVSGR